MVDMEVVEVGKGDEAWLIVGSNGGREVDEDSGVESWLLVVVCILIFIFKDG